MVRKMLKTGLMGALAASMVGCSATAPTQTTESATNQGPVVDLPMQATEQELVAPETMKGSYDTQQIGIYGGRRYRFRRIIIASLPYYVPYYYPTTYTSYVPYYFNYDPSYYYVPAYYSPYFGARYITIRVRRRHRW